MKIKKVIFEHRWLYRFCSAIRKIFSHKSKYIIKNKGKARLIKDIQGKDNAIFIGKGCVLVDTVIHVRGNNNRLVFNNNCFVGPNCSFWMEGSNINITIGEGTTFTELCHLNAQEDETSIVVGQDCMFSNHIIVRTSDSHPIYDITTAKRTNNAENVIIGNHVWVAPNSKIMKGGVIGDGSIIGSDTTVTKEFPANVLIVGRPAKIVKENVEWTREKLF